MLRPPIALGIGPGILTWFPLATAFALTLGADSPCSDERGAGNLGLSASGLFTRFNATHVSSRTSDTSSDLLKSPSQAYRTLPSHVNASFSSLRHHRVGALCRPFAARAAGKLKRTEVKRSHPQL